MLLLAVGTAEEMPMILQRLTRIFLIYFFYSPKLLKDYIFIYKYKSEIFCLPKFDLKEGRVCCMDENM